MKNRYIKKNQRCVNKTIRNIHKILRNDVFGNRYTIKQTGNYFFPFKDGSGQGEYYVNIELKDNKTGVTKNINNIWVIYTSPEFLIRDIMEPLNDFIVVTTDFWNTRD